MTQRIKNYLLIGFVHPTARGASAVAPIFVWRNKLYLQVLDQHRRIKDFAPTIFKGMMLPSDQKKTYRTGDAGVFAFAIGNGDVIQGDFKTVKNELLKVYQSGALPAEYLAKIARILQIEPVATECPAPALVQTHPVSQRPAVEIVSSQIVEHYWPSPISRSSTVFDWQTVIVIGDAFFGNQLHTHAVSRPAQKKSSAVYIIDSGHSEKAKERDEGFHFIANLYHPSQGKIADRDLSKEVPQELLFNR